MTINRDSLEQRVALVTGVGSGIGKASAKILAHAGAAVALVSRTAGEMEETHHEITQCGGRALSIIADISDSEALENAVQQTIQTWGQLDIVHCNAGINGVWAPIEELTEKEWDATLNINLKGTFLTIKHTVPYLKKRGGTIIVTGSVNGTRIFSNSGATAYACSKAGQLALTKMLAVELGPFGIRINIICPGRIESKIEDSLESRHLETVGVKAEYPEGRVPLTHGAPGTSGQVAQLVWFLATEASSHITGTEIYIDGAQSLLQG